MKRQLILLATLATALMAMAPAPKPIVTLDGIATAARLTPAQRNAIAPLVTAFDAGLHKLAAAHKALASAKPEQRAQRQADLKAIHDECHEQFRAIAANLTPDELEALHEYLHAQLAGAGIPFMSEQHAHHGLTH